MLMQRRGTAWRVLARGHDRAPSVFFSHSVAQHEPRTQRASASTVGLGRASLRARPGTCARTGAAQQWLPPPLEMKRPGRTTAVQGRQGTTPVPPRALAATVGPGERDAGNVGHKPHPQRRAERRRQRRASASRLVLGPPGCKMREGPSGSAASREGAGNLGRATGRHLPSTRMRVLREGHGDIGRRHGCPAPRLHGTAPRSPGSAGQCSAAWLPEAAGTAAVATAARAPALPGQQTRQQAP